MVGTVIAKDMTCSPPASGRGNETYQCAALVSRSGVGIIPAYTHPSVPSRKREGKK